MSTRLAAEDLVRRSLLEQVSAPPILALSETIGVGKIVPRQVVVVWMHHNQCDRSSTRHTGTMRPLTELLFSLRTEQTTIDEVGADLQPVDLDDGYGHQAELVEALAGAIGGEPIGYKVALTSVAAQQLVGHGAPVFGTMLSSMCWDAPA